MEVLISLRRRLEGLSAQKPTTYKVPRTLRDVNTKAYEPQTIAIGPYHHGKDELKGREDLKLHSLKLLLARKPEVLELYTSTVARMERRIRDFYGEDTRHMRTAEFTEMLVVDGCFVHEFIHKNFLSTDNEFTDASIHLDLLVLENQIPFFLLCEFNNIIHGPGPDQHTVLMDRVLHLFRYVFPGYVIQNQKKSAADVKHILDLIHWNWCATILQTAHLIVPSDPAANIIPSATQLKDVNVKFAKKNYESGTTALNVEFREDKGILLMPTLRIYYYTETLLRNLIAFEQIASFNGPTPVTCYAVLLDRLINSSKDVEILCQYGIIENHLGSDEVVADIANNLTKSIFVGANFIYADTFNSINAFHKRRWNRIMGVYHRDYFNSPWSYVSFIAAVLVLLLTIAQTLFATMEHFKSPSP